MYTYLGYNNEPIQFIFRIIPDEPDFNKDAKYVKTAFTERRIIKNQLLVLNEVYKKKSDIIIMTEVITDDISVLEKTQYISLSPLTRYY